MAYIVDKHVMPDSLQNRIDLGVFINFPSKKMFVIFLRPVDGARGEFEKRQGFDAFERMCV